MTKVYDDDDQENRKRKNSKRERNFLPSLKRSVVRHKKIMFFSKRNNDINKIINCRLSLFQVVTTNFCKERKT